MIFLIFLLPFVEAYEKFQKEQTYQFAYAPNLVCDLVEHAGMYYASVSDAFTFQRSEAVAVWPAPMRVPEACFIYHDHSYIMFFNRQTNRTDMLRNREYRSYPFPSSKKLIFDSLRTQLYLYEGNRLHRLDLQKIEALWSDGPMVLGEGDIVYSFSDYQILDILIVNDQLLFISKDDGLSQNRFIRTPYSKNKITQVNLGDLDQEHALIRSTNQSSFGYIPVSLVPEEDEYRISTLPPFPKRPAVIADLSVLLLYIIDIAIFSLIIYFVKTIKGPTLSAIPH